jgi:Uncharacterized protein conserved in bacteria (DUF2219)
MAFAFATSLVTLMCQGCATASGAAAETYSEPAVAPSLGMTLAMPGSFGDGVENALTAGPEVQMPVLPDAVRLSPPTSRIAIIAEAPAPSPLSFTGSSTDNVIHANANLGWSANPILGTVAAELAASRYGQPDPQEQNMSLGISIAASSVDTGLGFDVGLAPRVAVRDSSDFSSRRFGGEVRFGQGLGALDKDGKPEGWYVFLGSDGEALVWDTDVQGLRQGSFGDMQLTDQITVGDLQAGMSIQRGGGELSLSYIRREMEFSDRNRSLRDTEDFAGITFTMRR